MQLPDEAREMWRAAYAAAISGTLARKPFEETDSIEWKKIADTAARIYTAKQRETLPTRSP